MDVVFAAGRFNTALSILASHPGRIQERLISAYEGALSRIPRADIPTALLPKYDSVIQSLVWMKEGVLLPPDDPAQLLVTAIADLSALLDDELRASA
jgi:hypothetical protein